MSGRAKTETTALVKPEATAQVTMQNTSAIEAQHAHKYEINSQISHGKISDDVQTKIEFKDQDRDQTQTENQSSPGTISVHVDAAQPSTSFSDRSSLLLSDTPELANQSSFDGTSALPKTEFSGDTSSSLEDEATKLTNKITNEILKNEGKIPVDAEKIIRTIDTKDQLSPETVDKFAQSSASWMNPFDYIKLKEWVQSILISIIEAGRSVGEILASMVSTSPEQQIKELELFIAGSKAHMENPDLYDAEKKQTQRIIDGSMQKLKLLQEKLNQPKKGLF